MIHTLTCRLETDGVGRGGGGMYCRAASSQGGGGNGTHIQVYSHEMFTDPTSIDPRHVPIRLRVGLLPSARAEDVVDGGVEGAAEMHLRVSRRGRLQRSAARRIREHAFAQR